MKRICWLFIIATSNVFAQFDVNTYLSRTVDDVEIQAIRAQEDFASNTKFRSSIFREFELRFRARDFETGFDDYRFRIGFLNPFERKANKQYGSALQTQLATQRQVDYAIVLASRYRTLVQHRTAHDQLLLNAKSITIFQQLFHANAGRSDEAKELIELDKKLFILDLKQQDLASDLKALEQQIKTYYAFEGTISSKSFEWIQVPTIAAIMNQHQVIEIEKNIHVLNESNKANVSEKEYQVNKQEAYSNIGYIQAEYRPYRGESIDETLGVQVGVLLPIVNPDKADMERRELDLLEDQQEAEILRTRVVSEQNQRYAHILYLIDKYEQVTAKLEHISSANLTSSGGNLSALVAYTAYIQDLTELRNGIYTNLVLDYIDWLEITGLLAREPVNYLSDNLEVFGDS